MKTKITLLQIIVIALIISILVSYSSFFASANTDYLNIYSNFDFEDNSLLLNVEDSYANSEYIEKVFKNYDIEEIKDLSPSLKTNIFKISFSFHDKEKLLKLINTFSNVEGINNIEPNYSGNLCAAETYSSSVDQWGLYGNFGINITNAWNITTGSFDVRVGVIDTGVSKHKDLEANLAEGWNFIYNNNDTNDEHGHGTMVAGVIGANGSYVNGVNKKVTIVPLKISKYGVMWTEELVAAINYAESLYGTEKQIDILNLSASYFPDTDELYKAISDFSGLFVNSAGNKNIDIGVTPTYPASYNLDNLIAVGAINSNGEIWYQDSDNASSYGANAVDLFAPGADITSTYLGNNPYASASGTSLAAPFVSGVAALIYAKYPYLTAREVKAAIVCNVKKVDSITTYCATGGTLDAYKALSNAHKFHTVHTSSYQSLSKDKHSVICKYCDYVFLTEDHTKSYHFENKDQHWVGCAYCDYYFGLEQHSLDVYEPKTKIAKLPEASICTGCNCIFYRDGRIVITYDTPDILA